MDYYFFIKLRRKVPTRKHKLGMDTAAIQSRYIWNKGLQMLGVALLGVIATVLVGFFSARMAAAVGRQLRHDLFAKVEEFSNAGRCAIVTPIRKVY